MNHGGREGGSQGGDRGRVLEAVMVGAGLGAVQVGAAEAVTMAAEGFTVVVVRSSEIAAVKAEEAMVSATVVMSRVTMAAPVVPTIVAEKEAT